MTIPIQALQVGKCYLTNTGRVWRIVRLMPDGRVLYEQRASHIRHKTWKPGMLDHLSAELLIEREVPCDWTSDAGEAGP